VDLNYSCHQGHMSVTGFKGNSIENGWTLRVEGKGEGTEENGYKVYINFGYKAESLEKLASFRNDK